MAQFLQDPVATVALLVAGAAGAMLVLTVALLLLRGRDRELRALRVDHSLERDRRARLEAEKEALERQLAGARSDLGQLQDSSHQTTEQLNEVRNAATRLEAQALALEERLTAARAEQEQQAAVLAERERERDKLRAALETARNHVTDLEARVQYGEEQRAYLEQAERRLNDTFKRLSGEALEGNREQLLADLRRENTNAQQAVDGLVKPVAETLQNLQKAQASLNTSVGDLNATSGGLQAETRKLVNALRRPEQRGRWGELQLRRCVELAGMQHYVDFVEQETMPDGGQRPDMVVHLPNNRRIVVDAKTPMDAYISAWETRDEAERHAFLQQHADQVRRNLDSLSQKRYQDSLEHSPDFVVMFIPGEVFYSAALEQNPALFEHGMESRVLIATPTILIALLRSVHMGWREAELAREAEEIGRQGKELYRRANILVTALTGIRKGLNNSVEAYNKAIGSLNTRFIPQVERFSALNSIAGEDLPQLDTLPIDLRKPRKMALKTGADETPDE